MTVNVNETVEKVEKVVVEEVVTKTYDLIGLTATELKIIEALIIGGCEWTGSVNPLTIQGLYETIAKVSPAKPSFHMESGTDGFKKMVQYR